MSHRSPQGSATNRFPDHATPGVESDRIASLDGLRALAISLVLVAHLSGTNFGAFALPERLFILGDLGVRIFFVISGFLITTLLMKEEQRYGSISLRRFYFRRTLRIFPAFYVYLLVIVALAGLHVITLRAGDVAHAMTYTMNYHRDRAWELGHLWSLSVEEQFYLLWPLVVAWLGMRRAGFCAAAMIVVVPIARTSIWVLMPQLHSGIGETFITVTDSIAVGCVLALVRPHLERIPAYQAIMRSWLTPLIVVVGLFAIGHFNDYVSFGLTVGESLQNLLIALLIDWSIRNAGRLVGVLLNSAPMVRLGVLSYSLYLWQQLFLHHGGDHLVNIFPLNIALALLLASVSYWLVESPVLKLRGRLEQRFLPARNARRFAGPTVAAASTGE